ncbi:xanthine dehydrogenase molybdopterin binding subunit [Thiomonas sp.]|uniref:Xanthine dehydrogenase large subunit n=1 Tax=mine drainage metagenome TaxID=410659 RepID=E6PVU6_9ZZZZ
MNKPRDPLPTPPATPGFARHGTPAWAEAEWPALREGARVGVSPPHESAHLHVSGQATYTDDTPELAGTLHAALGLSPLAHGRLLGVDVDRIRALPGVVAVYTANDVPGTNDCGPVIHDDPILAEGNLRYFGQPVFLVVAASQELARRAAAQAREVIRAEPLPALLTAREAHAQGHYVLPSMHLRREARRGALQQAMTAAPHRLRGSFSVGGQEQFYLEGQVAYAMPTENAGMRVLCSTQHPSEMQHVVAHMLGWMQHQVQVECRRMGGGFGGKESQSAQFACCAALAAHKLQRPVKLRLDRDDDFLITGRRHGFDYDYAMAFDDAGRILAYDVTLIANAGHSADLSGAVVTRAICHVDNAYWLPNVAIHGHAAKTNTQSNTAFRGFGGPQGALVTEFVLDSIARKLGRDPLEVRRANFYGVGQRHVTPYGQGVTDNVIGPLVDQLAASANYAARRAAVATFNARSPVLKKGLALTPVKFGISFNVPHLNQAGALVHVYADGSVLVNHGGTEMGQGLNTKVAQVVAQELGVDFAAVRCSATDTHKVANTSATAASTGADLNGMAALDAASTLRQRLAAFAADRYGGRAEQVRFSGGQVHAGATTLPFATLVQQAYLARVQLWSDGFYTTPDLHWNAQTLTGHPFYYFAYGAAVSEVLVDTLTGEWRLLRADILHDAGKSLNPAIDIGQIEGAFIQGMGWLTMEELVWQQECAPKPAAEASAPPRGAGELGAARRFPETGLLLTHAPSTYKIPTANDCPPLLHTALFDNPNAQPTIHRSKAVGEPPLLLPFSVLLAIRDAVSAVGDHRIDPPLRAPATPEAILDAIEAVRAGVSATQPFEPVAGASVSTSTAAV